MDLHWLHFHAVNFPFLDFPPPYISAPLSPENSLACSELPSCNEVASPTDPSEVTLSYPPLSESELYSTFLPSTSVEGGGKGEGKIRAYFPISWEFSG